MSVLIFQFFFVALALKDQNECCKFSDISFDFMFYLYNLTFKVNMGFSQSYCKHIPSLLKITEEKKSQREVKEGQPLQFRFCRTLPGQLEMHIVKLNNNA